MRYPSSSAPNQLPKLIQTKKLAWALNEYEDIHRILNIETVYRLNKAVEENTIKDYICLMRLCTRKK